jgi:hypothetical protein
MTRREGRGAWARRLRPSVRHWPPLRWLVLWDRRVLRGVGQAVLAAQDAVGRPSHPVICALAFALYSWLWCLLCELRESPTWVWFLLGPGVGLVTHYLLDHEPAALLAPRLAFTRLGCAHNRAVLRACYPLLLALLVWRTAAGGDASTTFLVLVSAEGALFWLIECLLAFRPIAPRHPNLPVLAMARAIEDALSALPTDPDVLALLRRKDGSAG